MNLKPTQKAVLKVLVDNEDKWICHDELCRLSGVASNHVKNAVTFFMNNDYVYQPNYNGEIMVSPDGISAYYSS